MENIVGIRFEPCGKIYGFRSSGLELKKGEAVIVESEMGMGIGKVVLEDFKTDDADRQLKSVLRRCTEDDLRQEEENASLKREAFEYCLERIKARGLPMKLIGTEATLDRKRIIFYFVADNRIDFRELVKDLAARFRTRIELRQIGVRDAARMVGGIGLCGRDLCCRRFLVSFEPVSIKMAKRQELSLNASKLSGLCGRLMCCLGYERGRGGQQTEEVEKEEETVKEKHIETTQAEAKEPPVKAVEPAEKERLPREKEAATHQATPGQAATHQATPGPSTAQANQSNPAEQKQHQRPFNTNKRRWRPRNKNK